MESSSSPSSEAPTMTTKQGAGSTPTKKNGMMNKGMDKKVVVEEDDGLSNVALPKRPSSVPSASPSNNGSNSSSQNNNSNNNNNNGSSKGVGAEKTSATQQQQKQQQQGPDLGGVASTSTVVMEDDNAPPSQLQDLNHDFLTDADAATESIGGDMDEAVRACQRFAVLTDEVLSTAFALTRKEEENFEQNRVVMEHVMGADWNKGRLNGTKADSGNTEKALLQDVQEIRDYDRDGFKKSFQEIRKACTASHVDEDDGGSVNAEKQDSDQQQQDDENDDEVTVSSSTSPSSFSSSTKKGNRGISVDLDDEDLLKRADQRQHLRVEKKLLRIKGVLRSQLHILTEVFDRCHRVVRARRQHNLLSNEQTDDLLKQISKLQQFLELLDLRVRKTDFHVVIVGLEKAGKTTFINAMIGCNLLPTSPNRCTQVATEVRRLEEGDSGGADFKVEVELLDRAEFEAKLLDAAKVLELELSGAGKKSEREHDDSQQHQQHPSSMSSSSSSSSSASSSSSTTSSSSSSQSIANRIKEQLASIRAACDSFIGGGTKTFVGFRKDVDRTRAELERFVASEERMYVVRRVRVFTKTLPPHIPFVIEDVPGFDSPLQEHKNTTKEAIVRADAFLVLSDASRPDFSAPALKALNLVKRYHFDALSKAFGIMTRLDQTSSEELCRVLEQKSRKAFEEVGFAPENIFPVCSVLELEPRTDQERAEWKAIRSKVATTHKMLAHGMRNCQDAILFFLQHQLPLKHAVEYQELCKAKAIPLLQQVASIGARMLPDVVDSEALEERITSANQVKWAGIYTKERFEPALQDARQWRAEELILKQSSWNAEICAKFVQFLSEAAAEARPQVMGLKEAMVTEGGGGFVMNHRAAEIKERARLTNCLSNVVETAAMRLGRWLHERAVVEFTKRLQKGLCPENPAMYQPVITVEQCQLQVMALIKRVGVPIVEATVRFAHDDNNKRRAAAVHLMQAAPWAALQICCDKQSPFPVLQSLLQDVLQFSDISHLPGRLGAMLHQEPLSAMTSQHQHHNVKRSTSPLSDKDKMSTLSRE